MKPKKYVPIDFYALIPLMTAKYHEKDRGDYPKSQVNTGVKKWPRLGVLGNPLLTYLFNN